MPPGIQGYIVIPARNESPSITAVLGEIRGVLPWPVIVVDDDSHDDTGARARDAGAMVLPLAVRLGAWGATQAGLRLALRQGADYVVTMDADGQHIAESLPLILAPALADEADVVIGACVERASAARQWAWRLFRALSGLSVDDLTSGLRVYNRRALILLASKEATLLEYQDIGVLSLLQAARLRLLERRVAMRPRALGQSRIFASWFAVAYYMAYTAVLSLSKRGRHHPWRC